jgi:nucleotide-binding universal stress UspA family protein
MNQPVICPPHWRRLLACADGSDEAKHAVVEALALAGACGSQAYVQRVIEIVPEYEAVAPDLRRHLENEAREEMQALKAEAAGLGAAVETMICHSQSVHGAILAEAAKVQADLIVMGRSGRSGLARVLVGSVTARVIGHSPLKVLVIPQGAALGFARVLVAGDGSPLSEAAWEEALSLARASAEVRLWALTAAREEGEIIEARQILDRQLAAANRVGIPLTCLSPEGQQPDDAIVQAALRNEVDLIVMGSHGRTGFKRLLMGSVTERVIGQAPCPVLVVKKG